MQGQPGLPESPPLTPCLFVLYSHRMGKRRSAHDGPVDIAGLEQGVHSLINRCRHLESENAGLQMDLARLAAKCEAVEQAKNMARVRVEAVLSRLKSLEE